MIFIMLLIKHALFVPLPENCETAASIPVPVATPIS